ncbi:MAG: hypothetical protein Q6363_001665, partial [Candidatus Njordarchaeota archaeon]
MPKIKKSLTLDEDTISFLVSIASELSKKSKVTIISLSEIIDIIVAYLREQYPLDDFISQL